MKKEITNLPQSEAMPYDTLLGAVDSFTGKIFIALGIGEAVNVKYQAQYSDYNENQWTVPLFLTQDRVNNLINDFSVKKVKIIFENKYKYVLDA